MKNKVFLAEKELVATILASREIGVRIKRTCLTMIFEADGFTRPVFSSIYFREPFFDIYKMLNPNGAVCLNEMMAEMGLSFFFSYKNGYLINAKFIAENRPAEKYTRTIWLASNLYDPAAIEVSKALVDIISLDELVKKISNRW